VSPFKLTTPADTSTEPSTPVTSQPTSPAPAPHATPPAPAVAAAKVQQMQQRRQQRKKEPRPSRKGPSRSSSFTLRLPKAVRLLVHSSSMKEDSRGEDSMASMSSTGFTTSTAATTTLGPAAGSAASVGGSASETSDEGSDSSSDRDSSSTSSSSSDSDDSSSSSSSSSGDEEADSVRLQLLLGHLLSLATSGGGPLQPGMLPTLAGHLQAAGLLPRWVLSLLTRQPELFDKAFSRLFKEEIGSATRPAAVAAAPGAPGQALARFWDRQVAARAGRQGGGQGQGAASNSRCAGAGSVCLPVVGLCGMTW
jgi:hypothetical protein